MRKIDDTNPHLMFVDDQGWGPNRDIQAPYVPWPGCPEHAFPIIHEPTIKHRMDQIDHLNLHPVLGELPDSALDLLNLGRVALEQSQYEQADHLLSDSLALFCELGDKAGRGWSLQNLGRSALDQGLPDHRQAAIALFDQSLVYFRKVNDSDGIKQAANQRSRLAAT